MRHHHFQSEARPWLFELALPEKSNRGDSVLRQFFSPQPRLIATCAVLALSFAPVLSGAGGKAGPAPTRFLLKNGDAISGVVVEQDKQTVVIRSTIFGEITIPRSSILPAPATPAAPAGGADSKSTAVAATPTAASVPAQALAKPEPLPWRTKLEFGFGTENGRNDADRYSVLAQTERTINANSYLIVGKASYSKQNKVTTTDRTEALFRWRHNFPNRTFSQTQTNYYRDRITGIDVNIDQNAGVGYRVVDGERYTLNIGTGLTAQYRQAADVETGTGALGEVFQDQSFVFNDVTKLSQNLTVQYWPSSPDTTTALRTGEDNLKWRFGTTLTGKLSEHLSLNLRYEYDYDSAVVDPSARGNQRITSSLGYLF